MRNSEDVLTRPFDVRTHRRHFTDYLEVVVAPDGTVSYAVPSHRRRLESVYFDMFASPAILDCPTGRRHDYLGWLMERTGYICVWRDRVEGDANERQMRALKSLVVNGFLSMDVHRLRRRMP